jgi:hypothetical protein
MFFVPYAVALYLPDDGDFSPLHAGEFVCMDDLWFDINPVLMLVYVADSSSHGARNK